MEHTARTFTTLKAENLTWTHDTHMQMYLEFHNKRTSLSRSISVSAEYTISIK